MIFSFILQYFTNILTLHCVLQFMLIKIVIKLVHDFTLTSLNIFRKGRRFKQGLQIVHSRTCQPYVIHHRYVHANISVLTDLVSSLAVLKKLTSDA